GVSRCVVLRSDGVRGDYAASRRSRPQDATSAGAVPRAAELAPVAPVAPPPPAPPKPPRSKVNPHRLAQAEAQVATLEAGIAEIDARLADPAFHDGPDAAARATDAAQRRAGLVEVLAEAETALLALYEAS